MGGRREGAGQPDPDTEGTPRMPSKKEQLAAAAVRAGHDMVRAAAEHGIDSDAAATAARVADRALTDAETVGCTADDYAAAR